MTTMTQSQATGLAGFLCELTGKPVSFDACLSCSYSVSRGCPMFPSAIERILATQRPQDYAMQIAAQHGGADHAFSVTEIVYCPRRYRLAREHPYYERPTAMWRMLRGTAIHDFLANFSQGIREQTLVWRFRFQGKTIALVGTPDLLMETGHGLVVVDYKFTDFAPRERSALLCNDCGAEVSEDLLCPNCGPLHRERVSATTLLKPRNGHESQVLLYCLLVEKAMHNRVAGGQVIYLTRKPLKLDVRYDRNAALHILVQRLATLLSPSLPPRLEKAEELWQCEHCPLREQCETLQSEEAL